jgi:hypothetical protein
VIDDADKLLHLCQIIAKEVRRSLSRPLLLTCPDCQQLTHPWESALEVLLKLIEHLCVGQQTLLAAQTDEVAHQEKKSLEGVEHERPQPALVSTTLEIQRA